ISTNKTQLTQSRELLKKRLRALYRMSFRAPFLGGLLDSESFGDLTRKLKFETLLAESNDKILGQTLQHEEHLERSSSEWEQEQGRKKRILAALGLKEGGYSRERKNRTGALVSIRHQQVLRQQTITDLNAAAQDLQHKVALFLNQSREARKHSTWVSAGTGLMVKRGKIPWPVSGRIISPFGKYKNTEFNAVVENTGIQIQAATGTPIRAVSSGAVRYADWFKGYGKLVILDHGEGYYSLYAQASELNVSEGQTVTAGQVIGAVGDTGSLVGSSLYFEIRKNGVPQDPLRWLKHQT
ncbi:MAG TPA: peptidoglycan DD-metalloendopeptidase family protein, partial [bacterium]